MSSNISSQRLPDLRDLIRITRDQITGIVRLEFQTGQTGKAQPLTVGKMNEAGIAFVQFNSGGEFAEVNDVYKNDAERGLDIWARLDNPDEPHRRLGEQTADYKADGEEGEDLERDEDAESSDELDLSA